jgi:hypothetical protein
MKNCPFCTGSIPDEAPKCKHCGEWVTPRPADSPKPGSGDGMRMLGEAAKTGVTFYIVMSVVGLVIGLVFLLAFWLPQWNKMDKRHQEFQKKFDADWEKSRQRQEEFDKKFDAQWNR